MSSIENLQKGKNHQGAADIALRISSILLILLLLNLIVTHIVVGIDPAFRILVSCLPLAILIPGLFRGRRRSASLLCFALLLYFIVFVSALGVPGKLISEVISTLLVVLLFTSSMMFSTWQYRADIAQMEVNAPGGQTT